MLRHWAGGDSGFFLDFFFDPTCSNEVKVCIATQREREKRELVGTVNTKREKYITLVFGRERKKRERERERENRYIVLRLKTVVFLHKRERFWREKKSKPIMKGCYDRVS